MVCPDITTTADCVLKIEYLSVYHDMENKSDNRQKWELRERETETETERQRDRDRDGKVIYLCCQLATHTPVGEETALH